MAPRGLKGYVLLGSALIACPCHLPLIAALLAGTAVGGLITAHLGLVFAALAAYFVLALVLGVRWVASASESAAATTISRCAIPHADSASSTPAILEPARASMGNGLASPLAEQER